MANVLGIKTAAGVDLQVLDRDGGVAPETDPSLIPLVQYYKHFDLTDEQLGSTRRYNCWGFTFLPRRYWIATAADVDQILTDNCVPVAPGSLRPGDVIRYRDPENITTHTGRVWEVDGTGNCVMVRSKWGSMAEYVHEPTHPYIYQDNVYGRSLAYFRQVAPLKGVGDLWIEDATDDNGEQYSYSQWVSPDILVDAPPYGSVDVNAVFGKINRVSAAVRNRSDTDISNARVRYYWANPFAGFAPSNWQLIPATAGHPNPTDLFAVPANSSVQAPYVEWIPAPVPRVPDPAHQCLLAIAFVNDDPTDSTNPDPLVYPFEIAWDNNIAARNVHVVKLTNGGKARLQLGVAVPFDGVEKLYADLQVRLTFVPRMPVFSFPPKVVSPQIDVTLGDRQPFRLTEAKAVALGRTWGPSKPSKDIDYELLKQRGGATRLPEKTIASRQIKRLALTAKQPIPLRLELAAPRAVQPGTNFLLYIEQQVGGQVTGRYAVAISIV
jgi:hypothetical protein